MTVQEKCDEKVSIMGIGFGKATASQAAEKLTNVWITVEERPFRAA